MTTGASGDTRPCIITLHGVGAASHGDSLAGLERRLSQHHAAAYRRTSVSFHGCDYVHGEPDRPDAPTLLEVNWSDLQRPAGHWFSVFGYVVRLAFGTLHLGEHFPETARWRRWCLAAFRLLFEAFAVWLVPLIVYVMLLASTPLPQRWVVAIGGTAIIVAAAVWTRTWSSALRWGGRLCSVFYAAVGIWLCIAPGSDSIGGSPWLDSSVTTVSENYVERHLSLPLTLLALAAVVLWPARNRATFEQRLARLGLLYLPILGVALIGAALWVIAIPLVGHHAEYAHWSALHSAVLLDRHYDLQRVEWTHLGSILVLGGAALAAAAFYALRRWGGLPGRDRSGLGARNVVPWLCALVPVGTAVVGSVMLHDVLAERSVPANSVLDVYRISALRILPFLPWLLTPLVIVLDVLGDVVYFALPESDPLSIRRETTERFATALDYATSRTSGPIVVLAHSLGSMIAAVVLSRREDRRLHLVTIGSPVTSLFERFLAFRLADLSGFRAIPPHWVNLHRDGDYIGGPIEPATQVNNLRQTAGGHVGYWEDAEVFAAVQRAMRPDFAAEPRP